LGEVKAMFLGELKAGSFEGVKARTLDGDGNKVWRGNEQSLSKIF
jgi:hypothetical protein